MIPNIFKTTHPLRRINHVNFWGFVVLTILLAMKLIDIQAHDDEWFLAWLMGASAFAMLLPSVAAQTLPVFKQRVTENFIAYFEIALAIGMWLSWIGAFGPYRWGFGYDSFVHLTVSVLIALLIVSLIYAINPAIQTKWQAVVIIVVLFTIFAGVINELFEKYGDIWLGTKMYGEFGQPNDTIRDYVYDFFGAIIGTFIGIKKKNLIFAMLKI